MSLSDGASLMSGTQVEKDEIDGVPAGEIVFITKNAQAKRVYAENLEEKKRASAGTKLIEVKKGELLYASTVMLCYDIVLIYADGSVHTVNTDDIDVIRAKSKLQKLEDAPENAIAAIKQDGTI